MKKYVLLFALVMCGASVFAQKIDKKELLNMYKLLQNEYYNELNSKKLEYKKKND